MTCTLSPLNSLWFFGVPFSIAIFANPNLRPRLSMAAILMLCSVVGMYLPEFVILPIQHELQPENKFLIPCGYR